MIEQEQFLYKWWALLGLSLLAFTAYLDATIVNTALPFIQTAFQVDILQLQWIANIFKMILSMSMIAIGKFADLWGRKKVFYFGITIFAFAAFGAGLSKSVEILIFFRGLQAIGASTVFITSSALLSDVFPKRERLRAISIYAGVTGFGLMIGPFLGGVLISLLDWRWVFWINLPLITIGLILCSFSLQGHSHKHPSVQINWRSLILLIFGLGALMYGIITEAQANWASLKSLAILTAGIVALILLIISDEISKNPLLDLHIFKENLIILATLSCALAGIVSTVFMFFDPLYLHILRKLSPFFIGLLIAIIPAAQALISFVFSWLIQRFGVKNLLCISIVAAFLAIVLHRFIYLHTPLLFLILPFFLLGVNWGLSNTTLITAVNTVIAPHKIGAAIGTIATIWNIIGALLLAGSTAVFYSVASETAFLPAFHRTIDFNIAFTSIILIAALWICIKLRRI